MRVQQERTFTFWGGQLRRCVCVCASGSSRRTVSYCLCIDDVAWFRNLGCGFCSNTEIKFQPRPFHLEVPEMYRDTVEKRRGETEGRRGGRGMARMLTYALWHAKGCYLNVIDQQLNETLRTSCTKMRTFTKTIVFIYFIWSSFNILDFTLPLWTLRWSS